MNTLHPGDALAVLRTLPAASVHAVITSPPYWNLRDYQLPPTDWPAVTFTPAAGLPPLTIEPMTCCLGLEPEPWAFVGHLVLIFREVRRVLRDDGTCWVNLGDSYATTKEGNTNGLDGSTLGKSKGAGSMISARRLGEQVSAANANRKSVIPSGLKPKDLVGVPWMCAKALQADGWWLRSDVIWAKPNPMPESVTDRPTKAHEYVFLLAKSGTPQFWTHRDRPGVRSKPASDWRWIHAYGQELTQPPDGPHWKREQALCPECGGTGKVSAGFSDNSLFGGQAHTATCERCGGKGRVKAWEKVNLWRGHDYFYDAEAVREAGSSSDYDVEKRKAGRMNGNNYMQNGPGYNPGSTFGTATGHRNRRTVWTIATQPYAGAHFATFPTALVEPCLLASTSARGVCPACGAPWARVVERVKGENASFNRSSFNKGKTKAAREQLAAVGQTERTAMTTTTGWRPTCDCDAGDPQPATVLDPFFGSGTTGAVAIECGRHYVGIELSEEYIKLARRRLAGAQPALIARGLE